MRAAVVDKLGEAPRCGSFAEPDLQAGETLVHVSAAALKQLERAIVAGRHYSSPKVLPIVPGLDGVGTRDDGTRVYFMAQRRPFGAMAERAPASFTVAVPDGLDDVTVAAVVNPALAAWLPLTTRGRLARGETVMVLGATGAAGRMAVTMARHLGAGRVVACGRRAEVLAALGADATIELGQPEDQLAAAFAAEADRGVGVIVDYIWGRPAELLIGALTRGDVHSADPGADIRYVSVGAMAGADIRMPSAALRGSRLELIGSGTGNFPDDAGMRDAITQVFALARASALPIETRHYPLEAVETAWLADNPADVRPVVTMKE